MSYATKEGRRLQMQRYCAAKRQQGLCLNCRKPARPDGVRCAYHTEQLRQTSRQWMQVKHGHSPREPKTLHPQVTLYFEDIKADEGRQQLVLVNWRDPLTILLEAEERGWYQFMGPSPLMRTA